MKEKSRSPSPVDTTPVKEKIEFITAFGEDDANSDAKRKRPFEKSLLDECREAKKKAEATDVPIRPHRLATPPRLPEPSSVFSFSSNLIDYWITYLLGRHCFHADQCQEIAKFCSQLYKN